MLNGRGSAVPSVPAIEAFLVATVAAPVMWIVLMRFVRMLRKMPDNGAARLTVVLVAWFAGMLTLYGVIFIGNDMRPQWFTVEQTQIATRTYALSSLGVAAYCLWLFRDSE